MESSNSSGNSGISSTALVGGLAALGISVGGLMLASNNEQIRNDTNTSSQTESVINLPATNEKVNGLENRLSNSVDDINAQINRREDETLDYVNKINSLESNRTDGIERRIYRLEQEIFDLVP